MNKYLRQTAIVLIFSPIMMQAQLVCDNTITPQLAVESLLGEGIEVFNLTYVGSPEQIGTFECNGCNVGIGSGLIIASGDVTVAQGPNNSGSNTIGGGFFGATDPDLELINPGLNDAAVVEFDFIAGGDSVSFRYVFGSEEYPEFVGSFNDAFGFFLSGPGISGPYSNGAENIATLPITEQAVTINNVNNGNGDMGPCTNCAYYVINTNNNSPLSIQFDGFTTVLTAAWGGLLCGETYHIKIAIADALDAAYDSGVFIEAGSFSSNAVLINATASINTPIFLGDSVVVEGCNDAAFQIFRPNASLEDTLYLTITGSATNGVDYQPPFPDFVILEEGVTEYTLEFSAIQDLIDEGMENITLSYEFINFCGDTTVASATLYIAPYLLPEILTPDTIMPCPGTPMTISAITAQGYEPFTYLWNTNETNQTISINPTETTTYSVIATDVCGTTTESEITVTVADIPPLVLSTEDVAVLCSGDQIQIGVTIDSGVANFTFFWSNNQFQQNINVTPIVTTTYNVTVTDECGQQAQASLEVEVPIYEPVTGTTGEFNAHCPGDEVVISADGAGGLAPYTYNWPGVGEGQEVSVFPTSNDSFEVVITDACGETGSLEVPVSVSVWDEPIIAFPDTVCAVIGGTIAPITGGTGVYVEFYSEPSGLNFNSNNPGVFTANALPADYEVFIVDDCGNVGITLVSTEVCETLIPNIITPNGDDINEGFTIKGLESFPGSTLLIFNRWGAKVFESGSYDNAKPWNGDSLSDGVYFYILQRSDGEDFTGEVTLKRK